MQTIQGITVKVSVESYEYPEFRQQVESTARHHFEARYGFSASSTTWYYEAAWVFVDPGTSETLKMPAQWVLLVEGREPD